MTTLRSGICYRKSVYLLSITFLRPTQPVEIFGSVSMPLCTLTIRDLHYGDRPREPLRRGKNAIGVAKYSDFGPVEGNGARYDVRVY